MVAMSFLLGCSSPRPSRPRWRSEGRRRSTPHPLGPEHSGGWRRRDLLAHLIKKTLYVGFFAFLIGNFNGLAKIVFNSFSGLGLKAAGSALTADQFLQPGRLAQVGIDAG